MTVDTKRFRAAGHGLLYFLLSAGAVTMIFPLLWMLSTSLKTLDQITMVEIELIPKPIAWWNYIEIFQKLRIALYLRNSVFIVMAAMFGALVICSFVAYGFARVKFPGRDVVFVALLSTMMLPGVVRLIPLFVMFDTLGWTGSFLPLVVPRLLGHNPFFIFLMRQFFMSIPSELSDAARIDGCNEFSIWWRIILPLAKPVLTAVAIFSFQESWNDFLAPLIYLGPRRELWTLTLGLYNLKAMEGMTSHYNYMMGMALLMAAPVLLLFVFGQRYFVQGVTLSGLKG